MALESYLKIKNLNSKVTVIGSNPAKRELVLGFEDGSVQTYDHETSKMNFCFCSMKMFLFR
jgi:hypothetical protein